MALQKHTKIFTVFSFLRMKGADIVWYQWYYPTILFSIIYLGWELWVKNFTKIDSENIVADVNILIGILIGFYIAALAAISSFANENLDQIMKGRPTTLTSKRQGKKVEEELTRRRFLSILFGYCSFISMSLYAIGIIRRHISWRFSIPEEYLCAVTLLDGVVKMFYLWLISSLFVATLLGLHYLIERIHRI